MTSTTTPTTTPTTITHAGNDSDSANATREIIKVGKCAITFRKTGWVHFTDVAGIERTIPDSSGLVRKMVDAIIGGSGEPAPANVRTEGTLKPTNLRRIMGGEGAPQRAYDWS